MAVRDEDRSEVTQQVAKVQRVVIVALLLLFVGLAAWMGWPLDSNPLARSTPPPLVAQNDGVVGLFVQPDDGRAPVLDEIDGARETVSLVVYLLSDREIIGALERAVGRGVAVRVMLEEHPFGGPGNQPEVFQRLDQAGIEVRWGNPVFRFTHIKTLIVDGRAALVMNQNLTYSSFTANREFGVITTRPAEVAQAIAIFEADWERTAEPADGPLMVSPTTSREAFLTLIDSARHTMDIYAEVVRDREIMAALVAAEDRGIAVRLIMTRDDDNVDELRELEAIGVDVRYASGVYIHAKMVLVDDERAYVGSQNFTATSLDLNRELGMILSDPASIERLGAVFDRDFTSGTAASAP